MYHSDKIKHFYINKYVISRFSQRKYFLCYQFKYRVLWFRIHKICTRTIHQYFNDITEDAAEYIFSSPTGYLPTRYAHFFKFAFVRNPLDRLCSAWKNKVIDKNHFQFNPTMHEKMKDFGNFVDWVKSLDIERCDPHLRAQYTMIDLNHIDFIGRFEHFERDFQYVTDQIGCPATPIQHKNKSSNTDIDITTKIISKVQKIYYKDFNLFYPQ